MNVFADKCFKKPIDIIKAFDNKSFIEVFDKINNTFPSCLTKTAQTDDNLIMGLEHKNLPIYGVQYHPEAILTEFGHEIFKNFIS